MTNPDTIFLEGWSRVTGMVTRSKPQIVYPRLWRKFMGVKARPCADALDIDEKSYYRLERETWRIGLPELATIAKVIGVTIDQLFWKPPKPGEKLPISLDELAKDASPEKRAAIVGSIRGIMSSS